MKSASMLSLAAAVLHQERRSLRVRYRGGRGITGSGGGETLNSKQAIIMIVICATTVALLVIACGFWIWMSKKKAQSPNWRFQDYFKLKRPAAEKSEAMLHETRVHAEEAVVPAAHDNPRVNLGSKSRKQAVASREP
jgi:flagellar basal body-associated protein FliL